MSGQEGAVVGVDQQPGQRSTCLVPVWDGPYRMRCSIGTNGVCAKHGPHEPHPKDGRPCDPNPHDGYCHTHGVYVRNPPTATPDPLRFTEGEGGGADYPNAAWKFCRHGQAFGGKWCPECAADIRTDHTDSEEE